LDSEFGSYPEIPTSTDLMELMPSIRSKKVSALAPTRRPSPKQRRKTLLLKRRSDERDRMNAVVKTNKVLKLLKEDEEKQIALTEVIDKVCEVDHDGIDIAEKYMAIQNRKLKNKKKLQMASIGTVNKFVLSESRQKKRGRVNAAERSDPEVKFEWNGKGPQVMDDGSGRIKGLTRNSRAIWETRKDKTAEGFRVALDRMLAERTCKNHDDKKQYLCEVQSQAEDGRVKIRWMDGPKKGKEDIVSEYDICREYINEYIFLWANSPEKKQILADAYMNENIGTVPVIIRSDRDPREFVEGKFKIHPMRKRDEIYKLKNYINSGVPDRLVFRFGDMDWNDMDYEGDMESIYDEHAVNGWLYVYWDTIENRFRNIDDRDHREQLASQYRRLNGGKIPILLINNNERYDKDFTIFPIPIMNRTGRISVQDLRRYLYVHPDRKKWESMVPRTMRDRNTQSWNYEHPPGNFYAFAYYDIYDRELPSKRYLEDAYEDYNYDGWLYVYWTALPGATLPESVNRDDEISAQKDESEESF